MHHGAGLRRELGREGMPAEDAAALASALAAGDAAADGLTATECSLLVYATKLTQSPADIRAADIEALRGAGLDDRAIHDLACIVAYFAFVNRVADGLGVELESRE